MRYAVWNNKGGVGKTFLSFMLGTEYARRNPDKAVILVDMCPQANLSEIALGGNGTGSVHLENLIAHQKTIGGYFARRILSPHSLLGFETDHLLRVEDYNKEAPGNLYLICGDPILEVQSRVMNQLSSLDLPTDSWKTVHSWLKDIVFSCVNKLGSHDNVEVFIDCNPSFSAYTELALLTADRIIVPCSSDGSSARAINNVGSLMYGVNMPEAARSVSFYERTRQFSMGIPVIHSVILNRSTQYSNRASNAFRAMFGRIKDRVESLKIANPAAFMVGNVNFEDMPDSHSVAIVCSHMGLPLYKVKVGQHHVHDLIVQLNNEPLDRYKTALDKLIATI